MRRMNPATLRLVLLVSCCHGLVHVYEHSLAGVEELVVADSAFRIAPSDQTKVSGELGNWLRLPFGLCALLAGWLADRYGAKRLLLVYLLGCSGAVVLAWYSPTVFVISMAMFVLGMFMSIYHPAGVGLITHHTTPESRPMALGYHGIFGSLGIAAGPFLAGLALNVGADWRHYYLALSVPGVVLAVLLLFRLSQRDQQSRADAADASVGGSEDDAHWPSYFLLIALASLSGFVYAAIFHFLPRYLREAGIQISGVPEESMGNYLAAAVFLLGTLGQYTAGRMAKPRTLEPLLAVGFFAAAPCALWMAFAPAPGTARIWAAGLFSPLFFMHQPLYNSLVAKYVPRRRRSVCYGLSFTLGFGVGSFGPNFAGHVENDLLKYGILAGVLAAAGTLALVLWRWHGPVRDADQTEEALL